MEIEGIYKPCKKCGEFKELSYFNYGSTYKDKRVNQCKICQSIYGKHYHTKNKERQEEVSKIWREVNKEKIALKIKIDRQNNPEKYANRHERYYQANREKVLERTTKRAKAHAKAFPEVYAAKVSWRRAKKRQATPLWASEFLISTIYAKASRLRVWLNSKFDVDHIVPLISDNVCGLHCEANLQILTEHENRVKSNTYWPDMWDKD